MNVAPRGFPTSRSRVAAMASGLEKKSGLLWDEVLEPDGAMVVLRRNSCVIAMPIEAKANDVRNHARKVRSEW